MTIKTGDRVAYSAAFLISTDQQRTKTMNANYEIGGVCVGMTEAQAAAWNQGGVDAETLRGAVAYIPSRVGGGSQLIDGEVIIDDGQPTVTAIDLWTAIDCDGEPTPIFDEYMDGMPANPIN